MQPTFQEMGDHIPRQENQQIIHMKKIKKLVRRNNELEEEIKSTCDGYEEEIVVLLEKNEDLKKKLGVFMGDPAPRENNHQEDYIIIDDTDSDPDSDDDYVDEACRGYPPRRNPAGSITRPDLAVY